MCVTCLLGELVVKDYLRLHVCVRLCVSMYAGSTGVRVSIQFVRKQILYLCNILYGNAIISKISIFITTLGYTLFKFYSSLTIGKHVNQYFAYIQQINNSSSVGLQPMITNYQFFFVRLYFIIVITCSAFFVGTFHTATICEAKLNRDKALRAELLVWFFLAES